MNSMVQKWNYSGLGQVKYGAEESYKIPAAWFDEVGGILEDWGCGCATMRQYVKTCSYVGIDGSSNDYADRCGIDLVEYKSSCDCILLRDVLDHNLQWPVIIANALSSFKKRMVIVTFLPMQSETKVVHMNTDKRYPGVPDISFRAGDLVRHFHKYLVRVEKVNNETLFMLEK